MNSLQGFTQELSRDQHQAYFEDNESVRVEMPKQGSTVEFKDGQNQFRVPYIMYANFESILEPMDPVEPGSPNQPYTNEVNLRGFYLKLRQMFCEHACISLLFAES